MVNLTRGWLSTLLNKPTTVKTLRHILLLACLLLNGFGFTKNPAESNYVVIGAFRIQANAEHFMEDARVHQFNARYEINTTRKIFYVYVLNTNNVTEAIDLALKLRKESPYWDTWVFTGELGVVEDKQGTDIHPASGDVIETITAEEEKAQPVVSEASEPSVERESVPEVSPPADYVSDDVELMRKPFYFKVLRLSTQQPLTSDVIVRDLDNPVKTASYQGNTNVMLAPVNRSGNISVECEVFGYRRMKQVVNYNDPTTADGVTLDSGRVVVPFALSRLKKGDIAVMYNVYFFKDAAVMCPESRYEVNSLLDMMRENPKYKIKIHGHTNGKAAGRIIRVGESKNFFSLTDTREGYGSAKKLSEERARVIHDYLINEGIDAKRLHIKAWGGKRPVTDKLHALAHTNVRVEIEILEDN